MTETVLKIPETLTIYKAHSVRLLGSDKSGHSKRCARLTDIKTDLGD